MPVRDYGVVIGQFDHFDRDDANHFGSFFHGRFHSLAPTPSSGALDYVRNPLLGWPVWKQNVGMSALTDLEAFHAADGGIRRIYVFGAHFQNAAQNPPQGMHDVHMNQGDPPGPFQHLDGVWQDGGVVVERPGGTLAGFFVKFVTQTLDTNDHGLPA
jgi:hypothetical protein